MGGVDVLTRFPPCSAPYYTIPNDAQPLMPLTLPRHPVPSSFVETDVHRVASGARITKRVHRGGC